MPSVSVLNGVPGTMLTDTGRSKLDSAVRVAVTVIGSSSACALATVLTSKAIKPVQ